MLILFIKRICWSRNGDQVYDFMCVQGFRNGSKTEGCDYIQVYQHCITYDEIGCFRSFQTRSQHYSNRNTAICIEY